MTASSIRKRAKTFYRPTTLTTDHQRPLALVVLAGPMTIRTYISFKISNHLRNSETPFTTVNTTVNTSLYLHLSMSLLSVSLLRPMSLLVLLSAHISTTPRMTRRIPTATAPVKSLGKPPKWELSLHLSPPTFSPSKTANPALSLCKRHLYHGTTIAVIAVIATAPSGHRSRVHLFRGKTGGSDGTVAVRESNGAEVPDKAFRVGSEAVAKVEQAMGRD